jgi:hypothetical protein
MDLPTHRALIRLKTEKFFIDYNNRRLIINRPTKRGKDKSQFDRHCQCKKEMDDHLLAWQQIFEKESHSDPPFKRASTFDN